MVTECMQYKFNQTGEFNQSIPNECRGTYEECARPVRCKDSNKNVSCFAVWKQKDNSSEILSAGCHPYELSASPECEEICEAKSRRERNFCCCNENLCNKKELLRLPPPSAVNQTTTPPPYIDNQASSQLNSVILLAVILSVLVLVLLVFLLKRRNKHKNRPNHTAKNNSNGIKKFVKGQINDRELNELRNCGDVPVLTPFRSSTNSNNNHTDSNDNILHSTLDNDPLHQTSHQDANGYLPESQSRTWIDLSSIKLLEIVGSGRFGTVHRATLDGSESEIAVKIIQSSEQQSWLNELQIYSSPRIKHPNILGFLGTSESMETSSYWLVVEYASKGSLYGYLKENVVSWKELLQVALGVSRGLSHLHDIDIAHRDFKTKNVLLRVDLTPCVTDFGVALILDTSAGTKLDSKKKYLQVGTPRYMAPEVLECSVIFSNASFKKIDVYALSLVLWELLSRCHPLPTNTMSHNNNNNYGSNNSNDVSKNNDNNDPQHSNQKVATSDNDKPDEITHTSEDSGNSNSDGQGEAMSSSDGPQPYRLPFEELTGSNPDINTMRQFVNVGQHRPPFRPGWFEYPTSAVCRLCADGWEYDYDARISASCFVERVEGLLQAMNLP